MRATGRLCALLCASLAFLPASLAQAKIAPLPKPPGIAAKPALGHSGSLIAPVSRPAAHATIGRARPRLASPPRTTRRTPARTASRHGLVPAASHGGRERSWRVLSSGGRDSSALLPAAVTPTPLGFAGAEDSLPASVYAWPAWKIVLLALLAVAEAFVLLRLTRDRQSMRTSEI